MSSERNGRLYVPTPSAASRESATDKMHIDDTKDRIYVHDLDEEISDIEHGEDQLIFLPDIEEKLRTLPKSVLMGDVHPSTQGKEMVLYSVPKSLSVPAEQDSVRKAILEARERARDPQVKQTERAAAEQVRAGEGRLVDEEFTNGTPPHIFQPDFNEDEDAMDLG